MKKEEYEESHGFICINDEGHRYLCKNLHGLKIITKNTCISLEYVLYSKQQKIL